MLSLDPPGAEARPSDDPRALVLNVLVNVPTASLDEARELHHLVLLAHGLDFDEVRSHWRQLIDLGSTPTAA